MPFVSGPIGTLLVGVAALVALVLWLLRDRSYPGPRLQSEGDDIDREELEQAEREVRELETHRKPEEGFLGDDWGPGAGIPRPPERL
jgi:hypothetical protein